MAHGGTGWERERSTGARGGVEGSSAGKGSQHGNVKTLRYIIQKRTLNMHPNKETKGSV